MVTANEERAAAARASHPGVRVLADAEQLLAAAASHDLVVVAAPNRVHVELALATLRAGLHVVVDKPLAASLADAERLAAAAAESGLVAALFHNRRWDGDFLTLRRLLEEGRLGEPWRPSRASSAGAPSCAPARGASGPTRRRPADCCSTSART